MTMTGEVTLAKVREFLAWSWNCAIAEAFEQSTTKTIAQAISDGIQRGEEVPIDDLMQDFIYVRMTDEDDPDTIDPAWLPDEPEVKEALLDLVKKAIKA